MVLYCLNSLAGYIRDYYKQKFSNQSYAPVKQLVKNNSRVANRSQDAREINPKPKLKGKCTNARSP